MESVGSLCFPAQSVGVQLHDSDPTHRRGFGANPQPCNSEKAWACINTSGLCQRHADGVRVGYNVQRYEQLQYAQQAVSKSVQNSRTVPTSGMQRTLSDLYANRLCKASSPVRWAVVFRELPCQCLSSLSRVTSSTRRFLWATATRLSQVSCKHSPRSCTLVWVRDQHWQTSAASPRQKCFAATCSPSWTASLWCMGWNLLGACPCHCWRTQRGPRQMCGHAISLQRHTLGDAVQSGFRGSHTGLVLWSGIAASAVPLFLQQ